MLFFSTNTAYICLFLLTPSLLEGSLSSLPLFPLESTELCFALFMTPKSLCCTIALQSFILIPNHPDVLMVWHI